MRLDALLGALEAAPRLTGARCVGEHEIFDNEHGSAELEEYALNLCASCPALTACKEYTDSLPRTKRPSGIVAGINTNSRTKRKTAA
jgi:WhiB family redox-sensing transcriptional regulator